MITTLLSIAVLLLFSAIFSGSETAIFVVDHIRIKTLAEQGNQAAKLLEKMRANPKRLLGTLLLCNNAVNVAISALVTMLAIDTFGNVWVGLATGVATLLLVIFGEYLPKSFAAHHAEVTALSVAGPIHLLSILLAPAVNVIEWAVRLVTKDDGKAAGPIVSEEEIKQMARIGAGAGTVEAGEREMIERVFLFNDITASDVMTPQEDVEFLDGRKPLTDAMPVISRSKFSRYPVHGGDEDKATGVVHIKDIFEALEEHRANGTKPPRISEVADSPMFVPETKLIDDLFRDFQRQRAHMAIVINEFGSMVGLVTVDDLLAELVGEIADESDVDEQIVKRVDKQTIIVHGDAEVRTINRFFNVRIPGPSNKTVSRLILEKLGDIPETGRSLQLGDGLTATVEQLANLRITRVRLNKN